MRNLENLGMTSEDREELDSSLEKFREIESLLIELRREREGVLKVIGKYYRIERAWSFMVKETLDD